jgi:hypothetical protein
MMGNGGGSLFVSRDPDGSYTANTLGSPDGSAHVCIVKKFLHRGSVLNERWSERIWAWYAVVCERCGCCVSILFM